ncbi:MAG: winged helix-turn-helix transcriptional regulator [Solirubrobacterales bacterium]|jgi:DNA-binding MarR family transcriptional regulator|nr:winged helix-turn-helix transcriptional regulator [Solirubrobacterales bacterium]
MNEVSSTAQQTSAERAAAESEAWGRITDLWFGSRQTLMETCRELDLFPPQIMVLRTLDEPKPMREVAGDLACNSSNLTGITDRLEDRDLVRRERDPDDRRVNLLVLTDEGQRLRRRVMKRLDKPVDSMSALSDEELAELTRLLEKIGDA